MEVIDASTPDLARAALARIVAEEVASSALPYRGKVQAAARAIADALNQGAALARAASVDLAPQIAHRMVVAAVVMRLAELGHRPENGPQMIDLEGDDAG